MPAATAAEAREHDAAAQPANGLVALRAVPPAAGPPAPPGGGAPPIPEPSALFLVGTGLLGVALTARLRRRQRQRQAD